MRTRKYENVTPDVIFDKLQKLINDPASKRDTISIDTILLHFSLTMPELVPMLQELENSSMIRWEMPTSPSGRPIGRGVVRLL